jgi:hypothetical protein
MIPPEIKIKTLAMGRPYGPTDFNNFLILNSLFYHRKILYSG